MDGGTGNLSDELLHRKTKAFGAELIVTIPLIPERQLNDLLSDDSFLNCWDLSSVVPIGFQKNCVSRPNAPNK